MSSPEDSSPEAQNPMIPVVDGFSLMGFDFEKELRYTIDMWKMQGLTTNLIDAGVVGSIDEIEGVFRALTINKKTLEMGLESLADHCLGEPTEEKCRREFVPIFDFLGPNNSLLKDDSPEAFYWRHLFVENGITCHIEGEDSGDVLKNIRTIRPRDAMPIQSDDLCTSLGSDEGLSAEHSDKPALENVVGINPDAESMLDKLRNDIGDAGRAEQDGRRRIEAEMLIELKKEDFVSAYNILDSRKFEPGSRVFFVIPEKRPDNYIFNEINDIENAFVLGQFPLDLGPNILRLSRAIHEYVLHFRDMYPSDSRSYADVCSNIRLSIDFYGSDILPTRSVCSMLPDGRFAILSFDNKEKNVILHFIDPLQEYTKRCLARIAFGL